MYTNSGASGELNTALRSGSAILTSGHHDLPVSGRFEEMKATQSGLSDTFSSRADTGAVMFPETGIFPISEMVCSGLQQETWDTPMAALMFAYYSSYTEAATTPVLIARRNELNANDPNLRQLLVATSNIVSYVWFLWVPRTSDYIYVALIIHPWCPPLIVYLKVVLFPTYDAPKYEYGYQILILFGGLAIIGTTLMPWVYQRNAKGTTTV
ncbi:hypothetical protein VTL71DRAFT_7496 [Oculimacula yallundae]|uniref:Uncharacterized protein n=1 Tax=Oculimacula yallundae TaxID=86028 RepID=A0ABR4BWW0_9HELO